MVAKYSYFCTMEKVCVECTSMFVDSSTGTGSRGVHGNSINDKGISILMNAAWNGHDDCVNELLAVGADVNQMT